MRGLMCMLLSVILFCALIFGGSLPAAALPLPGRDAAWWGLLCPAFFGECTVSEEVIFTWPVLDWFMGLFRTA